jgi:hypothetical protein
MPERPMPERPMPNAPKLRQYPIFGQGGSFFAVELFGVSEVLMRKADILHGISALASVLPAVVGALRYLLSADGDRI